MLEKNPSFGLESDFPFIDLHALKEVGALNAALPIENTGLGLGHSPEGGRVLQNLLRTAGYRNLSWGRGLEGHINVLHLVYVYGSAQQKSMLATQGNKGLLAEIWVTDSTQPVTISKDRDCYLLEGVKGFASCIKQVSLALITAHVTQN